MERISDERYTPVLIVGTGISGLAVAYHLSKRKIGYTIVTKNNAPKQSNSFLSAANTRVPPEDEIHTIINLTIAKCGADRPVIEALYRNSSHVLEFFEELGLPFEKTALGFMPESPIKSHGGKKLINRLLEKIEPPLCNNILIHLEKSQDGVSALFYDTVSDRFARINANYLVLATGGYAAQFNYNDNSPGSTGEALILAKQIGARLKGMSTVMYHPWSIYNGRQILLGGVVALSEGRIVDEEGLPLLKDEHMREAIARDDYHEMIDDILRFQLECIKRNQEMYLDMSHADENVLDERMRRYGFSPNVVKRKRIKISPTMHYTSGGIEINSSAEAVDLNRVFVTGEAQFNGNLGSGRIPGQAFASGIVFGKLIADKIENECAFTNQNWATFHAPPETMTLYSREHSDYAVEACQKELSTLMIDLIASPSDSASLASLKERLVEGQNNLLSTAKGSGKRYEAILRLYFGYSIAVEIIEDLASLHRNLLAH
ncbi:L-aspartate oxidase [Paenibacillus tianmuensis]|uniref:L-aspartate oxidase n=1 Tax=Paenibacillus tianmuensis TaxID=624147 RepID=A0A1G4QZN3_9BACL|nr:FAD-binding protein [Paenibacillus tianmuensis]SCW50052.1 L-aspartate oxidase [Paenibacillus tianmuensis]